MGICDGVGGGDVGDGDVGVGGVSGGRLTLNY